MRIIGLAGNVVVVVAIVLSIFMVMGCLHYGATYLSGSVEL